MSSKVQPEAVVREIRRKARRRFSAEEKIRIVLEGLRGEESIACVPPPPSLSLGTPQGAVPVRAVSIDEDETAPSSAAAEGPDERPARTFLVGAAPNPGRGETIIRFAVGQSETREIRIAVYDVSGRRIAELHRGRPEPGWCEVSWNGLDEEGHRVAAGIYFVRFEAGELCETRKILQLR